MAPLPATAGSESATGRQAVGPSAKQCGPPRAGRPERVPPQNVAAGAGGAAYGTGMTQTASIQGGPGALEGDLKARACKGASKRQSRHRRRRTLDAQPGYPTPITPCCAFLMEKEALKLIQPMPSPAGAHLHWLGWVEGRRADIAGGQVCC